MTDTITIRPTPAKELKPGDRYRDGGETCRILEVKIEEALVVLHIQKENGGDYFTPYHVDCAVDRIAFNPRRYRKKAHRGRSDPVHGRQSPHHHRMGWRGDSIRQGHR